MNNHNLSAALTYARIGFRVAPVKPGKKWPRIDAWQDNATTNIGQITEWWTQWPDSGVSVVLDHPNFVVDVDPRHGGDDTLHELIAANGYDYPLTVLSVTGGGGEHHFMVNPTDTPIHNGTLGPGIDIRGVGGQVIVPPTIHPNGQPYAWEDGHELGEFKIATAPQWMIEQLTAVTEPEPRQERSPRPAGASPKPGDVFAATHTWPELLEADGWTLASRHRDGWEAWRGPHHNEHEGTSATLYYGGTDLLKVFTPSIPGLKLNETYTKFGYLAATKYGGDHSAAAKALGSELDEMYARMLTVNAGQTTLASTTEVLDDSDMLELIDWTRIGANNDDLVDGLVIPGRWLQIISKAKQGKSSLMMWIAICLSEGRHPWDGHPIDPVTVLYVDGEMGDSDMQELITRCGHDPLGLKNLHVSIDRVRLDTDQGASRLLKRVIDLRTQVVILDGLNGFIAPGASENDDKTWRPLYESSIVPMKRLGIAIVSGDNMGKNPEQGSRGSSVKTDKADGVVTVAITDNGTRLHRLVGRGGAYLSSDLDLNAEGFHDESVSIRFWRAVGGWPAGTKEAADLLDELKVPFDEGRRKIRKRLNELIADATAAGVDATRYRHRDAVIGAAIRFRNQRPNLKIVPSP